MSVDTGMGSRWTYRKNLLHNRLQGRTGFMASTPFILRMAAFLVEIFGGAVAFFVFCASIRYALEGCVPMPRSIVFRILTSRYWFMFLLVLIPLHWVGYASGETSPVPWVAFSEQLRMPVLIDGFQSVMNGIESAMNVVTVNLWLLWIPANLWVWYHPDASRRARILARLVNLVAGLALIIVPKLV